MTVEWLDDPSAFVAKDWTALVDADPEGTIFHAPRYLKLYWEEFGAGDLAIADVRGGAARSAVAAFEIADGLLSFLGGTEVTDYMGPVGIPEARATAAKELVTAVEARDDWTRGELRGLLEDGEWLPALEAAAQDAGLVARREPDGVAPFLELPETHDSYLASLRSKQRHELRRKERRLRAALPTARLVHATPETLDADMDRFIDLHSRSRGAKGRFMVPGMALFFCRLADELLADGTFVLSFLEADGEKLAGTIGFRDGAGFRLYNSAYDHDRRDLAPGMVLVNELVRWAIEEGRSGFDFLTGDLAYKYRFGARPRRVARLVLERP